MMKLFIYTSLALIAFSANSVLCRLALGNTSNDPVSFTAIRLASGALVLCVLVFLANKQRKLSLSLSSPKQLAAPIALFVYALAFSWAYVSLDTGVGALLLFGTVQLSLIGFGIWQGHRLGFTKVLGVLLACTGFVVLVWPNLSTPAFWPSLWMVLAGIAWAVYTAIGAGSGQALVDTARNFVLSLPLALLVVVLSVDQWHISTAGAVYAVLSGAVASGLGYALWYAVLPRLAPIQAAVLQLLVPVLAAFGGVLLMAEAITTALLMSSLLVLGGVLIVLLSQQRQ